jgi:hypothetical protein
MPKARIVPRKGREISILCEDRPGTLSHLAKLLGSAKVNIVAVSCTPAGVQCALRLIVDNLSRAKKALDLEHLPYTEHDVLYVELPNLPGSLAEFSGKLAAQNINITTAYGAATKGSKKAVIIFKVSDLEKALAIR